MEEKEISRVRPDGILLVIAYFVVLGVGLLLAGLFMLVAAVPQSLEMAQGDGFFFAGFAAIAIMTLALLVLGGLLLNVARNLWRAKPGARAQAVVLAAVIAVMALLSMPAFFFAYSGGTYLLAGLGTALVVGAGGAASLWYLARPHVKDFFLA